MNPIKESTRKLFEEYNKEFTDNDLKAITGERVSVEDALKDVEPRDLVPPTSKILKEHLPVFDFADPEIDPLELTNIMIKTMLQRDGLGLSANQVGLPHRMFVMKADTFYSCFNPKIVSYSDEKIVLEEGCLSYPGLFVKIKRPKIVRVRFQTPMGVTETRMFDGLSSRIFQHEMDHLDGVIFYKRANVYHREMALKKWNKKIGRS